MISNLPTDTIKKEARELREKLTYHAEKYYVYDSPEISDYDYDMMYARLVSLEECFRHHQVPHSHFRL